MSSGVNLDPRVNGNGNGVHLNGVARKRAVKPAPAKEAPELSGFAVVPVQAIDAQMWPAHAVMWLEPVMMPVAPSSSGLGIQRHRVPVPDFIHFPVVPACCPRRPKQRTEPVLPDLGDGIPKSDLSPLGWEPRAICIGSGKEPK